MREVGASHASADGAARTPTQVALNWLICKGALPIVGVKNERQAEEAAGARGWRLSAEAVRALDAASDRIGDVAMGAPFENW